MPSSDVSAEAPAGRLMLARLAPVVVVLALAGLAGHLWVEFSMPADGVQARADYTETHAMVWPLRIGSIVLWCLAVLVLCGCLWRDAARLRGEDDRDTGSYLAAVVLLGFGAAFVGAWPAGIVLAGVAAWLARLRWQAPDRRGPDVSPAVGIGFLVVAVVVLDASAKAIYETPMKWKYGAGVAQGQGRRWPESGPLIDYADAHGGPIVFGAVAALGIAVLALLAWQLWRVRQHLSGAGAVVFAVAALALTLLGGSTITFVGGLVCVAAIVVIRLRSRHDDS